MKVRGEAIGGLTQEEIQNFINWAWVARGRTTFDNRILSYNRTAMLIAETHEPMAFLPVQMTLMAEAFIPRPSATPMALAYTLGQFDNALMNMAGALDVGEVHTYVPVGEQDYMKKIQRHGWVEIPDVRLFKKPRPVALQEGV
jgi:hypothetical protein